MSFGFLDAFWLLRCLLIGSFCKLCDLSLTQFGNVYDFQCLLFFSAALIIMLLFTSECGFWTANTFIFKGEFINESILSVLCRLEGNRMNIPHRILTADGSQKPFNKSLAESDSSSDYVTPSSSMADVSSLLHINVKPVTCLWRLCVCLRDPWCVVSDHDLHSVCYSVRYSVSQLFSQ